MIYNYVSLFILAFQIFREDVQMQYCVRIRRKLIQQKLDAFYT